MLSGLYSAATAMNAAEQQHEVIARNLAHANVPGYRRDVIIFKTFESELDQAQQANVSGESQGVAPAEIRTDFTPGLVQRTELPLDLAIEGEGFFVLDGPDGPLYTRNGTFHRSSTGMIVSAEGLPLSSDGGTIVIPEDVPNDQISVAVDGVVRAAGSEVGRVKIVRFDDTSKLRSAGTTVYTAEETTAQPATSNIVQGSRELSNVSAVEELVHMLTGMRQYEAAQRALRALSDAVGQHTNPQGG